MFVSNFVILHLNRHVEHLHQALQRSDQGIQRHRDGVEVPKVGSNTFQDVDRCQESAYRLSALHHLPRCSAHVQTDEGGPQPLGEVSVVDFNLLLRDAALLGGAPELFFKELVHLRPHKIFCNQGVRLARHVNELGNVQLQIALLVTCLQVDGATDLDPNCHERWHQGQNPPRLRTLVEGESEDDHQSDQNSQKLNEIGVALRGLNHVLPQCSLHIGCLNFHPRLLGVVEIFAVKTGPQRIPKRTLEVHGDSTVVPHMHWHHGQNVQGCQTHRRCLPVARHKQGSMSARQEGHGLGLFGKEDVRDVHGDVQGEVEVEVGHLVEEYGQRGLPHHSRNLEIHFDELDHQTRPRNRLDAFKPLCDLFGVLVRWENVGIDHLHATIVQEQPQFTILGLGELDLELECCSPSFILNKLDRDGLGVLPFVEDNHP
mmetsp:Transcript_63887/g.161041  ORF Transcript_63887/g.161041 Transcript_63887/m.161041 type:complete len:429 (-) Transcript_63887:469-1755(-)